MKELKLLLLLAIIFLPKIHLACSCIQPSSFCESITDSSGELRPELIIRGTIAELPAGVKEARISQVIYGSIDEETIKINWSFCGLYYNNLEHNGEYMIALKKFEDNYFVLDCAISFLKIENEKLIGKVAPGLESIDFYDFFDLQSCHIPGAQFGLKSAVSLYPNPTNGELSIKVVDNNMDIENLEIIVFDILGRRVSNPIKSKSISEEDIWTINIESVPSGPYMVWLSNSVQNCTYRIIKE